MNRFAFTKVEGLGNDFALFDGRQQPVPIASETAVQLCDRHRGIGADGLLLLEPSSRAAARLTIWNADGSQAEMCGNGLRCAAQLLLAEAPEAAELVVETKAGLHRCRPSAALDSPLGAAALWVELVGLRVSPPETLEVAALGGLSVAGRRVRLGNPHFVVFEGADAARAAQLGPVLERHRNFGAERTNVEFCELAREPTRLRVRVWERGVGLTQACGTGAAAAAVAAWTDGLLPRAPTLIELPGGLVRVDPIDDAAVGLCGPAHQIYSGSIAL